MKENRPVHGPCGLPLGSLNVHSTQDLVTDETDNLTRDQDVDTRMGFESFDEVVGHAGAEVRTPDHDSDGASLLSQEDRCLSG